MESTLLEAAIREILTAATSEQVRADAAHDARTLARFVGDVPEPDREARAITLARDRATGRPLPYVLGVAPFCGHEFIVEPGVLYPRATTEILVTAVVRLVEVGALPVALWAVDMCGGSANVGCAIALALPNARVWSADLMPECSALARRNVARHGLEERVEVVTGDLFGALAGHGLEGAAHVVTCSPPFISSGKLAKERAFLLEYEPREAFDAGPYGIVFHQRLARESAPFLRAGGYLVCEYGEGQAKQVEAIVRRTNAYDELRIEHDSADVARAISARRA
jgi:release factor glutamine methyltransferase